MNQNRPPESPPISTRIAVCSWSLRPNSPQDLIERIHRLELGSIQLALSPMVNDPANWSDAIDLLRDAGIWIASGMMTMAGEDYSTLESIARSGGVRPDETWFANREHAEQVARLAHRHSIDLVTFHAGFISEDAGSPERAKLLDRLRTIADTFGHYGITVSLETGQETASTLVRALEELNCANLGVNFDPANMILYGTGDPITALRLLSPYVRQVHVKDALPAKVRGTWGRETPVGDGAVNWRAFFEIAMVIHPPVQFVIEREARSGKESDILQARDLIKRFVMPDRLVRAARDPNQDHPAPPKKTTMKPQMNADEHR